MRRRCAAHDEIIAELREQLRVERERVAELHSRLMARSEAEYATTRPYTQMERPAARDEEAGTFVSDDTGLIYGFVDDETDG